MKKNIRLLLKFLLGSFGYENFVLKKNKIQDNIVLDRNIWQPFFEKSKKVKLYFEALKAVKMDDDTNIHRELRFYSLQNCLKHIEKQDLQGDYAECGVWKGQSAFIIATHIKKRNHDNLFHIFDSFEGGLSQKADEDENLREVLSPERIEEEKLAFSSSKEEVESNLSTFDFIKLYKGWIPERFNEVKDKNFCFVHVDVDLYEPTLESLQFFYPRLSDNGIIVCDDYNLSQFPGAKKAFDEIVKNYNPRFFYEVPLGGCFLIK